MSNIFQILPGENDWWGIDCHLVVEREGPDVTISSFDITYSGNVIIDTQGTDLHPPQLSGNILYIWASANNSEIGDITIFNLTLHLSNGEIIPASPIYFYTVANIPGNIPPPKFGFVTISSCSPPAFLRTFDASLHGVRTVVCDGNGYTVAIEWHKEWITPPNWNVFYNIYWSTDYKKVYSEGVKFVVNPDTSGQYLKVYINGYFDVGKTYYFAIKGAGHEPGTLLFDQLPVGNDEELKIYPEAMLTRDITSTDMVIPLNDVSLFPPKGIVLIGSELIGYSNVDAVDGYLVVSERGLYGYPITIHQTNGFDGYHVSDPFVKIWKGWEDSNTAIGMVVIKFDENYARVMKDGLGFRERTDIVTGNSNLKVVDSSNEGFPIYDQTGWDRTFIPDYLSGKCVGTYFGGEYGCADGNEVQNSVRGLSVQDHMNMREEYLLQITGEPVILFKRQWEGKQSRHTNSTRENTTYRGIDTYGTSLVNGYEQYFSPRRSDGKILVRFGPTKEDYKREDAGIENVYIPNCWTLVIPSVKDGDFIIRFNQDGTEEWRYEIIDVERNRSLLQETGAQKFTAVRVRRTDPIYQVRAIRDTSTMPRELLTSIGMVTGPGGINAHMHRVVINEGIISLSQINEMTSIDQGHNHSIIMGQVSEVLDHSHTIIL